MKGERAEKREVRELRKEGERRDVKEKYQHSQTHAAQTHHTFKDTSQCPEQVQDHFITSGTRLAQEYLGICFGMKRATRVQTNGPRPTHSGIQGKSESELDE